MQPKQYRCKQCAHVSSTNEEQWRHARTHIPAERLLTGDRCEFVTEYKHHLEYHTGCHNGTMPLKCKKCAYTCASPGMLNSHEKSHNSPCRFNCKDCVYKASYLRSLEAHLRKYNHRRAPGTG